MLGKRTYQGVELHYAAALAASGFVIVPREPTPAMIDRGVTEAACSEPMLSIGPDIAAAIWRAMMDAALLNPIVNDR